MSILEPTFSLELGDSQEIVERAISLAESEALAARLWAKDASLWSDESGTQAKIINRLGWLGSPLVYRARLRELERVNGSQYDAVVLLGMGGSSLAPELFQRVFGNRDGYARLEVLDNTTADAVSSLTKSLDLSRTLFVIASKSGTTAETKAFTDHFYATNGEGAAFIAITDPGSKIIAEAEERGYQALFYNSQDIGGRYSVFSFFGLVPASLTGVDVEQLLERAAAEIELSSVATPALKNGALALGVSMAELATAGRDKLTFLCSPALESFADWAEQLVAESTGKGGKGLLPVVGERPGNVENYGTDRAFVYLRLEEEPHHDALVEALKGAGHPVIVQKLQDRYDVGAQFFRWEFATAVAGACLGINPFDEPNVTESKTNTNRLLDAVRGGDELPAAAGEVYSDHSDALREVLAMVKPGQYVAYMAYLPMSDDNMEALRALQAKSRDLTHAATTVGFGPRFLHSTGQFHKGGPPKGVFVQIVGDDRATVLIPGEEYDFSTLAAAQSLGDLQALQSRGYPTLRLRVHGESSAAIREMTGAL